MENMSAKELADKLLCKKQSAFEKFDLSEIENADAYAKDYAVYLDGSKTEREAVEYTVDMLGAYGFKPYTLGADVYPGDRFYTVNRNKSLIAFVIGSKGVSDGFRILAAHIDSPRLDLKQHPFYEDGGLCYAKTHYYGGIRKYQWATIRLALHGVVTVKGGKNVKITVGEDEGDPVFCISDLLPHLAKEQNTKPVSSMFAGEALNVIVRSPAAAKV